MDERWPVDVPWPGKHDHREHTISPGHYRLPVDIRRLTANEYNVVLTLFFFLCLLHAQMGMWDLNITRPPTNLHAFCEWARVCFLHWQLTNFQLSFKICEFMHNLLYGIFNFQRYYRLMLLLYRNSKCLCDYIALSRLFQYNILKGCPPVRIP